MASHRGNGPWELIGTLLQQPICCVWRSWTAVGHALGGWDCWPQGQLSRWVLSERPERSPPTTPRSTGTEDSLLFVVLFGCLLSTTWAALPPSWSDEWCGSLTPCIQSGIARHLSYATAMAPLGVFIALGGASYAAVAIPPTVSARQP